MKKDNSVRCSNIELLRIMITFGVIILHYNNAQMGGGFNFVEIWSANSYILYFLENISVCAVDVFVLISGFFMCERKRVKTNKAFHLVFQVVIFNIGILLLRTIMNKGFLDLGTYLYKLLPLNYYVTLYIVVYLLAPYINLLLEHLNEKTFRVFVGLLFGLFSVWPTTLDFVMEHTNLNLNGMNTIGYGQSMWGYTSCNFILMYIIGVYIRKCINKGKTMGYMVRLLGCWLIMFASSYLMVANGMGINSIWSYNNPIVILSGVYLFLVFYSIKEFRSKVINNLAGATFTVYLFHSFFLGKIGIETAVKGNPIMLLLHISISCVAIYLVCYVVYIVYNIITTPVLKYIDEKIKFPTISVE